MKISKAFLCMTFFVFVACENTENNYEYTRMDTEDKLPLLVQAVENNVSAFHFNYDAAKDCLYSEYDGYKITLMPEGISCEDISDKKIVLPYAISMLGAIVCSGNCTYDLSLANTSSLLLSFDDCYLDNWKKHLPLFTEHNLKATFFIYGSPDNIASFAKTVQNSKLEVGYHTLNHRNLLDFCDADTLRVQAVEPAIALHKKYIYADSFAFPNGVYTDYQIEELLKWYKILRFYGSFFTLYKPEEIGKKRTVWSRAIDNNRWSDNEHFKSQIFKELLIVRITESVFPVTSHNIVDSFDEAADPRYAITAERLLYISSCLEKMNMKSSLYKDFYYYIH